MRRLRDSMKASMAAALSELRNMQQLQDVLEQAQVSPEPASWTTIIVQINAHVHFLLHTQTRSSYLVILLQLLKTMLCMQTSRCQMQQMGFSCRSPGKGQQRALRGTRTSVGSPRLKRLRSWMLHTTTPCAALAAWSAMTTANPMNPLLRVCSCPHYKHLTYDPAAVSSNDLPLSTSFPCLS